MSEIRFSSIRLVPKPRDETCQWTVFLDYFRLSNLNKKDDP